MQTNLNFKIRSTQQSSLSFMTRH